jgi:hypothetical protein
LFATKDNPLASITPDAIDQGTIGNCYFLAAVASVAKTNPESIRDMIKDNRDGTFTVTFPGAPDQPITVEAPSQAELGLYNHGSKHGIWASVVEKAYGKYCQSSILNRLPNWESGNTPAEGADGGGWLASSIELLTGKQTDTDIVVLASEADTARKLTEAFSSNQPRAVTCGIAKGVMEVFGAEGKTGDGFPTAHAYSIIGFDPAGPDGGTVTVRNPWGGPEGSTDGTMQISLRQFRDNFSVVTYQA